MLLEKEKQVCIYVCMNFSKLQYNYIILGAHLYVPEEGSFEVTKGGMIVNKMKAGETFGELAILYNTKRFASVQGTTIYLSICNSF